MLIPTAPRLWHHYDVVVLSCLLCLVFGCPPHAHCRTTRATRESLRSAFRRVTQAADNSWLLTHRWLLTQSLQYFLYLNLWCRTASSNILVITTIYQRHVRGTESWWAFKKNLLFWHLKFFIFKRLLVLPISLQKAHPLICPRMPLTSSIWRLLTVFSWSWCCMIFHWTSAYSFLLTTDLANIWKYQISTVESVLTMFRSKPISYYIHATNLFCMLLTSSLMWIFSTVVPPKWHTSSAN